MTILDKIVEHKKIEIAHAKKSHSISQLEKFELFGRNVISAKESIRNRAKSGIIAEFKRKSPSKGVINDKVDVQIVTSGYAQAGASCISVLTDKEFFGGTSADLTAARKVLDIPILRKDFVIDEYQIIEAKALGADFILLIAACLTEKEVTHLARFAKNIGLEVLMEVHTREELHKCCDDLDIVGVNNRNLKDFTVDINYSIELFDFIPKQFVKISESGLSASESVNKLKNCGFDGFLMGEAFMKTADPVLACREFISKTGLLNK